MAVETKEGVGRWSRYALLQMLTAWFAALAGGAGVVMGLARNAFSPGEDLTMAGIEEVDFSGYSRASGFTINGPYADQDGQVYGVLDLQVFVHNGGPVGDTATGAWLAFVSGTQATGTAGQTGGLVDSPAVTAGGDSYEAPPRVVITDATVGTGATAHAIVTNGAVTGLVIDNPGSGYTGPIVTIDPPMQLVAAQLFDTPEILNANGNACPVLMELDATAA